MELWPISQTGSNQCFTCLIWKFMGLINCKPDIGDQERHQSIQETNPNIQESQRRSYNAPASIRLFRINQDHTCHFWSQKPSILNSSFPIKIGTISIHNSAVKKFPKSSLTVLNRPDTKPSSQPLNQTIGAPKILQQLVFLYVWFYFLSFVIPSKGHGLYKLTPMLCKNHLSILKK